MRFALSAGDASFASLTAGQQDEFLKSVEDTPFFAATRTLTLIGMFSSPSYGGNRYGAGWALIGLGAAVLIGLLKALGVFK